MGTTWISQISNILKKWKNSKFRKSENLILRSLLDWGVAGTPQGGSVASESPWDAVLSLRPCILHNSALKGPGRGKAHEEPFPEYGLSKRISDDGRELRWWYEAASRRVDADFVTK